MRHLRTYNRSQQLRLLREINESPQFRQFNADCRDLIIQPIHVDQNCRLATEKFDLYIVRNFYMPVTWGILSSRGTDVHIVARGELDKFSLSTGVAGFALDEGREVQSASALFSLWTDYAQGLRNDVEKDGSIYNVSGHLHTKMKASGALTFIDKPAMKAVCAAFLDPLFAPATPEQKLPLVPSEPSRSP